MNTPVTEKTYPIQTRWIFKSIFGIAFALVLLIMFYIFGVQGDQINLYAIVYFGSIPIYFIKVLLQRANFHYVLEDKYVTIRQGIFSKQERHIPYGAIQHIFVKQDLIDRIFGIASVAIENASSGGGSQQVRSDTELIGSKGNIVSIPGLLKTNAELLKTAMLQKIKENLTSDSASGL